MADDFVEVEFDPPRSVRTRWGRTAGGTWLLYAPGKRTVALPISQIELTQESTSDDMVATKARIPRWLAEKEGLVESESAPGREEMSRQDWFVLGMGMALVIQGRTAWDNQAVAQEARRLAKMLMEEE